MRYLFRRRAGVCDVRPVGRRALRSIRALRGSTHVWPSRAHPRSRKASAACLRNRAVPLSVEPESWLLAYVRGELHGIDGARSHAVPGRSHGFGFRSSVIACAATASANSSPSRRLSGPSACRQPAAGEPLPFQQLTPWLYASRRSVALRGSRPLERALRSRMAGVCGGRRAAARSRRAVRERLVSRRSSSDVLLVQVTAFLQLLAELVGLPACSCC